MANENREYVNFTLPKWIGEQSSMREYRTNDKDMAEITIPPHTNVTLPNGETMDASFHKLRVPKSSVHEWANDPKNYSIGMPVANDKGDPWRVDLIKEQGCWEHPEAKGDDRGRYIVYSTEKISLDSESFAKDMQNARDERAAWAKSQEKEQGKDAKAPSLKEEGKNARAASERLAKEAKEAPAKAKSAPAK